MDIILKTVIAAVICTVCVLLIKQYRPELSLFAQLAGLMVVLLIGFDVVTKVIEYSQDILSGGLIESAYLTVLLKALAIAIVSKIGGDLCRDSGNSALAFGVELTAKAVILTLTMPMIKNLADITAGLLKG